MFTDAGAGAGAAVGDATAGEGVAGEDDAAGELLGTVWLDGAIDGGVTAGRCAGAISCCVGADCARCWRVAGGTARTRFATKAAWCSTGGVTTRALVDESGAALLGAEVLGAAVLGAAVLGAAATVTTVSARAATGGATERCMPRTVRALVSTATSTLLVSMSPASSQRSAVASPVRALGAIDADIASLDSLSAIARSE